MHLREAISARRSVRAFVDQPVPRDALEDAVALAVQAPAPHHSAPWRFLILTTEADKQRLATAMGAAWKEDLAADGLPRDRIDDIVGRSYDLLTKTPALVVCCADMTKAHSYSDERRARAEWSLYAHSIGAALQNFMLALVERDIASCWISAPVFCGDTVRRIFDLPDHLEPHALILVGYASPDYNPRPRTPARADDYIIGPDSLADRE
ncbi:MAG TPA: nitroreductase family protein [Actinomycetota bacterium]|nr:nitroreductase family protein [Actinomycetota bacterium]